MRDAQRRLEQLEAQIQGVWPADVEADKARALARVRLQIRVALDAVGHPAGKADAALLDPRTGHG
jgi:hypothetical protein